MLHRSHKGKSGPRSNMYSRSRCSNWALFDPFEEEADRVLRTIRPIAELPLAEGERCLIYLAPVDARFIQPVTVDEVVEVLTSVPGVFLRELKSLLILGGTSKQDKLATGRAFHYGCYRAGRICLHAFPKRTLVQNLRRPHKPSTRQAYERMGARYRLERGQWRLEFDMESLRRFFLYDVLLHEVGHHVDRRNRYKATRQSERFAVWFADATMRQHLLTPRV
jgi:hypothetical protein